MCLQRLRLRYDQQVPEWEGGHKLGHIRRSACVDHYPGLKMNKPQDEIMVWPIETLIGPGDLPAEAKEVARGRSASCIGGGAGVPAGDIRPTYCPNRVVSAAGCDASRAWRALSCCR